jgi:dolichol-phosphate mannosyltransferase
MKLSIISPVYQAEAIIDELVKRITSEVSKITPDYEIILVEDGGSDNSWPIIEEICRLQPEVRGVKFSRNFGQHIAISAGIDLAVGDYAIVIDCDLQDDPKEIPRLVNKALEGYDIVYTVKSKRNHSFLKNMGAYLFNLVFNFLTSEPNVKSNKNIGSYSIISKKVIEAYRRYPEVQRHYLLVLRWLGFSHSSIDIEHKDRFAGKSSYSLRKMIDHAIQGITSQSDKMLKLNVYAGFVIAFLAFLVGIILSVLYFTKGFMSGWTSLIVTMFFVLGLLLISIGIVGVYIGKIFQQVKNRPLYLIDKHLNS